MFEGEYLNGINGKRNGLGKDYYPNGILMFEGEYLNEFRNGKGKKYTYDGKLMFEGEYLYNKNLKGKFFINEKLEYEDNYINKKFNGIGYDEYGKIIYKLNNGNGKVKEYDDDGILIFEGEYLNGLRNGNGRDYDYEGILIFEGKYLNGLRNGNGKEHDELGLIFEGEYLNGKRWKGKGKEYDDNGILIFEGEYLNGKKHSK